MFALHNIVGVIGVFALDQTNELPIGGVRNQVCLPKLIAAGLILEGEGEVIASLILTPGDDGVFLTLKLVYRSDFSVKYSGYFIVFLD